MIAIRKGELADKPRVLDLLSRVWEDDYVPNMWEGWVTSPEQGIVLVAEQDGEIAGTCYINFMPHQSAWFQAMRIDPKFRRQRIGTKLTEASLAQVQSHGIKHVYLGIDAENTPSLTMTAGVGFRQVMQYERVTKVLPPRAEGDEVGVTNWRQAVSGDLADLERIADKNSSEPGLFACWQWQLMSRVALERNILANNLWLWGRGEPRVWAGFEDFGEYIALFPPCGDDREVLEACDELIAYLPRKESATFEAWLNPASPLLPHLRARGFDGNDGTIIWEYQL